MATTAAIFSIATSALVPSNSVAFVLHPQWCGRRDVLVSSSPEALSPSQSASLSALYSAPSSFYRCHCGHGFSSSDSVLYRTRISSIHLFCSSGSNKQSKSLRSAIFGKMNASRNYHVDDAMEKRGPISGMSMMAKMDRIRVPSVLNRALGNIISTGDKLGGVMRGTGSSPEDNSVWKPFAPSEDGDGDDGLEQGEDADMEDEEEYDAEEEDDPREDSRDLDELLAESTRLQWRTLAQHRRSGNTNRLLRARTEASAAVVVDGPFSKLQEYMNLPVSEYKLLDSSLIQRLSDTSFRLQVPLRDLGLDFSPTVDVEVELDPTTKAVVFRSTRSTLYGTGGGPSGKKGKPSSISTSTSTGGKIEYFRVGFNARLHWADGEPSRAVRPRGRPKFRGGDLHVVRRPRPSRSDASAAAKSAAAERAGAGKETENLVAAAASAGARSTATISGAMAGDGGGEAVSPLVPSSLPGKVKGGVERATVFCEAGVKVQVVLPPPYNTVLPWRLVRALLGKVLSTTVRYMLPRFLELLADDFYSRQPGSRQPSTVSMSGAVSEAIADDRDGRFAGERPGRVSRGGRRGGGDSDDGSASDVFANPVVGGIQRLRNVRSSCNGRSLRSGLGDGGGVDARVHARADGTVATVVRRASATDRAALNSVGEWSEADGITRDTLDSDGDEKEEEKRDDVGGERRQMLGIGSGKRIAGSRWRPVRWRRTQGSGGGFGEEVVGGDDAGPVAHWWG